MTDTQQRPAETPAVLGETGQCIACLATMPASDLTPVRASTPGVRGCKDIHACTDRVIARLNRIARGRVIAICPDCGTDLTDEGLTLWCPSCHTPVPFNQAISKDAIDD